MKKYGTLFLSASLALLLVWVLPWLYNLITLESYATPFTLYSCTLHDFASVDRGEGKGFRFIDTKGNVYGDEAQPMFYASVLASRGALPDTLEGRKISLEEIERNSVIASSDPRDLNRAIPPVYLLMESVPERLELKDPEDALISRKGHQHPSGTENGLVGPSASGTGLRVSRPPFCRKALPPERI